MSTTRKINKCGKPDHGFDQFSTFVGDEYSYEYNRVWETRYSEENEDTGCVL